MSQKLTMVYWKGERFWLGKLLQHPEIMTQGETLEELEENLKDAFRAMAMDARNKTCPKFSLTLIGKLKRLPLERIADERDVVGFLQDGDAARGLERKSQAKQVV